MNSSVESVLSECTQGYLLLISILSLTPYYITLKPFEVTSTVIASASLTVINQALTKLVLINLLQLFLNLLFFLLSFAQTIGIELSQIETKAAEIVRSDQSVSLVLGQLIDE